MFLDALNILNISILELKVFRMLKVVKMFGHLGFNIFYFISLQILDSLNPKYEICKHPENLTYVSHSKS